MKKVVITGANSMLGISLTNYLVSQGTKVLLLVREEHIKPNSIISSPLITIVDCAMSDYSTLNLPYNDFDSFIHLAWSSTTGEGRNNAEVQEANIKYTLDAVRLASRLGCKMFLGAGSQAEYGIKVGKLKADDYVQPVIAYGVSKFAAGKLSLILANQLGIRHCWARILSVYGPYDGPDTLINYVIKCMRNNEMPILTPCEQKWDYLYVDDAARALSMIVDKGANGKIYPIGSGKTHFLKEYINLIRDIVNPKFVIKFGLKPYNLNQVMYLCADIKELCDDVGFYPKIDFVTGINNIINN